MKKGTCRLIDGAISGDGNVVKKEAEKILKTPYNRNTARVEYKDRVIPVITGRISESFRKYLSNITEMHEIKDLQKTAILGTAHVLRKVLM